MGKCCNCIFPRYCANFGKDFCKTNVIEPKYKVEETAEKQTTAQMGLHRTEKLWMNFGPRIMMNLE